MIEGIGSIVRYMGTNWINGCFGTPPVWGVRKDTEAENSVCNESKEKKDIPAIIRRG